MPESMQQSATPPREVARRVWERLMASWRVRLVILVLIEAARAALLIPSAILLGLSSLALPLTIPLAAEADRLMARLLGAEAPSGCGPGTPFPIWLASRVTKRPFWRQDLPLVISSLLMSGPSFGAGVIGVLGLRFILRGLRSLHSPGESWWAPPLGVGFCLFTVLVLAVVATARLRMITALSRDQDAEWAALTRQVGDLRRGRATLVDAFEAERIRIERDLHDGAQQRLTALTMTLGAARLSAESLPESAGSAGPASTVCSADSAGPAGSANSTGPANSAGPTSTVDPTGPAGPADSANSTDPAGPANSVDPANPPDSTVRDRLISQLDRAQEQAEAALAELRSTVRSVRPAVLTERGLIAGVRELCAGAGIEVALTASGDDSGLSDPVSTAVYFAISEALTNAARHSGASSAHVHLLCGATGVSARIEDKGVGGAIPETTGGGTGLAGLAQRLETIGGSMHLDSAPGEGTTLLIQAPASPPW